MSYPVEIPDSGAVAGAASGLGTAVDAFDDAVIDIQASWAGLGGSYSAPEGERVLQAMAPLGPVRDELLSLAATAKDALQNYADELALLATRRAVLVADIETYHATPVDPLTPSEWPDIQARITRFDIDADAADSACASALNALHRYYSWSVAEGLDVANSVPSGVAQGLAAEMLSRYRELLVPGPGAEIPDIPRLDQIVPDEIIGGNPYTRTPSGLLVPLGSDLPDAPSSLARPPGWGTHGTFTPDPALGSPPGWARWGGRALNVVGAGLAYWGTYTDRYNETLVDHPEWNEDERVQSAATHSAVVGSTSVAGGMGGAWGGAAAGAAIGSIFPGPGTVIGGVIGGVVGGVVGSGVGEAIGDWAMGLFGGDE